MNINADEALQYLSNAGIISIEQVRKDIENMKKNKYLEMHQNPVWQGQGKDTRWKTRLPNGKIVAKAKKEDLEKVIIQYYSDPPTFDDLYHQWRKFQDQMVSDNTTTSMTLITRDIIKIQSSPRWTLQRLQKKM